MVNLIYNSFSRFEKIEYNILWFIQNRLRTKRLDFIMHWASKVSNVGLIWIILAIFLGISGIHHGFTIGTSIIAGFAIHVYVCNVKLKKIFARPRPDLQSDFQGLVKKHKDYSFPSGHACSSFIVVTLCYCWESPLFFIVLPFAILVAFSRIYLSVHYPSDVLAGVCIGGAIGYVTYLLGVIATYAYSFSF